ncbi:MAG: TIM barrel protein [Deltaproteobacteria bacterium]|nr:TIM barrel protein [Deltaproteobacteria bacterium]
MSEGNPLSRSSPTLTIIRHLWGLDGHWRDWLTKIKASGYAGVEGPPPADSDAFAAALRALDLHYVCQIVTHASDRSATGHFQSFKSQIEAASPLSPLFFTSHSGVDMWPLDESRRFLSNALTYAAKQGLDVSHETHRGRIFFNPRDTLQLLSEFPDLQLTADLSHWVNVCERIPDDATLGLALLAPHIRHIHGRVGYAQGPQVPDPRAPAYALELAAHERWWAEIWRIRIGAGQRQLTLTPEFGPPPYQQTSPYTALPLADPWDVSLWMAARLRERFAHTFPQGESPLLKGM